MTSVPLKGGYVPPRGSDGKIIIGPIVDDVSDDTPEAPAEVPPAAPAPVRRIVRSDAPTSFEALRPGAASVPPASSWRIWVAGLGALVLIAFGVWVLFAPAPEAPAVVTEGTEAPAAAVVVEGVTQGTERLPFAVVAFAEPEGAPIGALEPGRAYTVVAEQGQWAHLDVAGSGAVWVRTWELRGQPRPTAIPPTPVPTSAPAPAAPAPAFVAPPASTCVAVVDGDFGGVLGQACGATTEERQARALELLRAADQSR